MDMGWRMKKSYSCGVHNQNLAFLNYLRPDLKKMYDTAD